MQLSDLGDGGGTADGCEASFVQIMEVFAGLALKIACDICSGGAAFLQSSRRNSGKQISIFVFERSQVSNDEDLRMSGDAQVFVDHDAARAVKWGIQFLAEVRRQ